MRQSCLMNREPFYRTRFLFIVFFFFLFLYSKVVYCYELEENSSELKISGPHQEDLLRVKKGESEDLVRSHSRFLEENVSVTSTTIFPPLPSSVSFSREEKNPSVGLCLVHSMLEHALLGYFGEAFPFDAHVVPQRVGVNTQGSLYTTLIDCLDTLAITNHTATFMTSVRWIVQNVINFDLDQKVSVFETILRILGGLLSAHLMIEEGIMPQRYFFDEKGKEPEEFVYRGELLILATDLMDRLLPAFLTSSGIPVRYFNLHSGFIPKAENEVSNSEIGTCTIEMMLLSHFTGNPQYREVAERGVKKLLLSEDKKNKVFATRFTTNGLPHAENFVTIGGGQDSTIEYFLKYHMLSGKLMWWRSFERARMGILGYLGVGGMYFKREFHPSKRFLSGNHDSLYFFYPGLLLLGGRKEEGMEFLWEGHGMLRRWGLIPDSGSPKVNEDPPLPKAVLRPEHVESVLYYYHATHDPAYEAMGEEFARGMHLRSRVGGGLSSLRSVSLPPFRFFSYSGFTESFLLAETLKYLYLLLEEVEWTKKGVHWEGGKNIPESIRGGEERNVVSSPPKPWMHHWIFTSEAHMIPDSFFFWAPEVFQRKATGLPPTLEAKSEENTEKDNLGGSPGNARNRVSSLWSFSSRKSMTIMRLEIIHNIMSLEAYRSNFNDEDSHKNRFRKMDWIWDDDLVGDAGYFCANYPRTSLSRVSSSFVR